MNCYKKFLFKSSVLLAGTATIAGILTNNRPTSLLLAQNILPASESKLPLVTEKSEKDFIVADLESASIPQQWENKQYQPPSGIGRPRNESVEPGGSRSGDDDPDSSTPEDTDDKFVSSDRLLLLTPSDGYGVTTSEYPTFLVYIADRSLTENPSTTYVEFVLSDRNGAKIYQTQFPITSSKKIIGITLPQEAGLTPPLVGKEYQWSLAIYDRIDSVEAIERSEGWITRVEMKPELAEKLKNASELDKARLYIQAEIWYDAVATLADLHRKNPHNSEITADWQALLNAVGLNNIARISLFPN
jgi:hypothetical protein